MTKALDLLLKTKLTLNILSARKTSVCTKADRCGTYDTVCVCVCVRSGLMDLELGTFVSRNCQLCVSQPPDNMDADVKCVSTSTSFTE